MCTRDASLFILFRDSGLSLEDFELFVELVTGKKCSNVTIEDIQLLHTYIGWQFYIIWYYRIKTINKKIGQWIK